MTESNQPAEPFARLKLDGPRFQGGRLPIGSLEELQRYQRLVLEAARLEWLERNDSPIPADFDESLELSLVEVEPGSAVPVLERTTSAYDDYFDLGRDELDRELDGALRGTAPVDDLPLLEFPAFAEFGSSLEPDEVFEINVGRREHPILITQEITDVVLRPLAYQWRQSRSGTLVEVPLRTEERWVVGRLTALDADRRNYTIRTARDKYVNGRFRDPEVLDDLRAVLNSSESAPLVRFFGRMRYQGEQLTRILDVTVVQVLGIDGQPWSRRFIELGSLEPGWHEENPQSVPIAFAALDGARAILEFAIQEGLPLPGLFPLDDGGVNVEWASQHRVLSIEVGPDAEFFAYINDRMKNDVRDFTTENLEEIKDFIRKVEL